MRVIFDKPKMSNLLAKLVTEFYTSTMSVVCDFQFPRMFLFLNLSCLACCDNTRSLVKSHKLYTSNYGGWFEKFIRTLCIMVSARNTKCISG